MGDFANSDMGHIRLDRFGSSGSERKSWLHRVCGTTDVRNLQCDQYHCFAEHVDRHDEQLISTDIGESVSCVQLILDGDFRCKEW